MSTIHAFQGSTNIANDVMLSGVDTSTPPFQYLTPEMLLEFCKAKLRGIDEQVQRAFASQQSRNNLSSKLGDLSNALQSAGHIDKGDQATKDDLSAKYQAAIDAAGGPTTELGKDLQSQKDAFTKTTVGDNSGNNDPGVDSNEMKSFVDSLGRTQSTVNTNGELSMIQLQSLMSQRQQALQMCTNMVSSLGQSSVAIAQNIGK